MFKNKTAIAIALFLTLTIAVTLVALPAANAHTPPRTIPTWTYITCVPEVVGVDQQMVLVVWSNALPPTGQGGYGDRWTFTVSVTKPDGSEETLPPITSDPVGGSYTTYTPTDVGKYSFVATMEEHFITGEPFPPEWGPLSWGYNDVNDTYLESTSDPAYLTVQEEPIEAWKETSLPTEYWERPINDMNRDWYRLAGNWLAGVAQNVNATTRFSYGLGPESAHIMWATPMWAGGIMDERFGETGYQTAHYEGIEFNPPIILNGKIYYNVKSLPRYGWYCLNLYTGEVEYFHNTTGSVTGVGNMLIPGFGWVGFDNSGEIAGEKLAFGQIYDYESPNQHGGLPYLWSTGVTSGFMAAAGTTWMMFDAYTGNYICSIANVSSAGTQVYGKDGSILYYNIQGSPNPMGPFFPAVPPFYLQVWNTSQAIWYEKEWQINEYWMWRPVMNKTFDGNNGFSLNVSIPDVQGSIFAIREDEFIIGGTAGSNDEDGIVKGNLWCLSLEAGEEGKLLWNRTFTPPYDVVPPYVTGAGGLFAAGIEGPVVDPEDGVFLFESPITRERWGFSLDTMEMIWGPTEPEHPMNYYGMYYNIYEGKLFSFGYGGEIVAYNITTGDVLWTYNATSIGFESPYGGNYPIYVTAIADGKLYTTTGEHSITQPMWRGPNLRCINATTGEEIWKIAFFGADGGMHLTGTNIVMADGYVVGLNYYDNQIYCLGKGPTATTVTASPEVSVHGDSVLIKGTVTDQSPGTKTTEIMAKSPNAEGIPAISDEDMSAWMEYLYMQQAKPADAKGVEVVLETLDPNGNFYEIGNTTSDAAGMFKLMFTPEVPGEYTIIATFAGSKSYYGSYAETAIGVSEAPAATPEPTPTPASIADMYLVPGIIGIIIAIVAVGVVIVLMLRKR